MYFYFQLNRSDSDSCVGLHRHYSCDGGSGVHSTRDPACFKRGSAHRRSLRFKSSTGSASLSLHSSQHGHFGERKGTEPIYLLEDTNLDSSSFTLPAKIGISYVSHHSIPTCSFSFNGPCCNIVINNSTRTITGTTKTQDMTPCNPRALLVYLYVKCILLIHMLLYQERAQWKLVLHLTSPST
mgnify:CR=1 FL=1